MSIQTITQTSNLSSPYATDTIDWTLGWRYEEIKQSDGTLQQVRIPLTAAEILHPQEGYIMPERKKHDDNSIKLRDMLLVWSVKHPEMTIFHDLIFVWDHPDVGNFAPDVAIVPNVRDPERDWGTFNVAEEGTRPILVIEVVSPKTQKADRENKVIDYAKVGIQEYVYIDTHHRKRGTVWHVVGYRLNGKTYQPIPVDEDGAVFCETINARIGIDNGVVWIEDRVTGEDLMGILELERAFSSAEANAQAQEERAKQAEERAEIAEERMAAEVEARRQLEQEIASLKARLQAR